MDRERPFMSLELQAIVDSKARKLMELKAHNARMSAQAEAAGMATAEGEGEGEGEEEEVVVWEDGEETGWEIPEEACM
eukprot:3865892-Pleurochrysis_carterae.AAC.1